jgi:hypothetical protein
LGAKEEVLLKLRFSGDQIAAKVRDLIDKGASVDFKPGELKVTGSKLFDEIERTGCTVQARVSFPGSLSLACWNQGGLEIGRLPDLPGQFSP